ncbi:DUF63 family protein [Candidatus Micrarchaeota archaeon]|nr:DUF63 family protein [Candidatus Micrarchaeota archaeon]
MDFWGVIDAYFIRPVYDRTGYNIINTLVYAAIALFFAFIFFKILKREKVKIDEKFVLRVIPFILLGSAVRVVTDATGVPPDIPNQFLQNSSALFGLYGYVGGLHIYDYSFLTATPGIYIFIGALTFLSIIFFNRVRRMNLLPVLAVVLLLPQLILLLPLMKYWLYFMLIVLLSLVGLLAGKLFLEKMKVGTGMVQLLVVLSHSLDGAASYVAINLFMGGTAYFEQHVVSSALGAIFGTMFAFYVVKVLFSSIAVWIVETSDDKRDEKNYILLLLIIFGLAPGVRDILRLLAGV